MNEKELQELVQENKLDFKIIIEGNSFRINEVEIFQTDNPITARSTRTRAKRNYKNWETGNIEGEL